MARFVDPLIRPNFIDANIMDQIADGQDEAVQELVRMQQNDEVNLVLAHTVLAEVNNPSTPEHVKRAAASFLQTLPVTLTSEERRHYQNLLEAAIGKAELKNISADLSHVFEAAKYGGYFITRDRRLLNRASVIRQTIQAEVVNPEDFLAAVEKAKLRAKDFGLKQ